MFLPIDLKNLHCKFDYLFFGEPVLCLISNDNPKYINDYFETLVKNTDNTIKYDKNCFAKHMWEMGRHNLHKGQVIKTLDYLHTIKEINMDEIIDSNNNKIKLVDIMDYDEFNITTVYKDIKNSWPNFGEAGKLLNEWQEATMWDKNGKRKNGWTFLTLKNFTPYNEFYGKFGDYLYQTNKDFKEMFNHGKRDDPKITISDIAEMNIYYFSIEFMDFLQKEYLVTFNPVKNSAKWTIMADNQLYELADNTQNFKNRWNNASILVIGCNYLPDERKRWEKVDKYYIGLGFSYMGTELKFTDGNPLDYYWERYEFEPLIALIKKTNKKFNVYLDNGVWKHLTIAMKLQCQYLFDKLTLSTDIFDKNFDKSKWNIISEIPNPIWNSDDRHVPYYIIQKRA